MDSLHERLQSSSEAGPTAVLDVRTAWEFSKGHIPGAMHISLDTLSDAVRPSHSQCAGNLQYRRQLIACWMCKAQLLGSSLFAAVHADRVQCCMHKLLALPFLKVAY